MVLPLPLLAREGEDPAALAADGFGGAIVVQDEMRFDREAAAEAISDLYLMYLQNRTATRALDLHLFDTWPQREAQVRRAQAVSTVLMGPISLALRLLDDEDRPMLTDNTVVDALAKHLYLRLQWQRATVGRSAEVVLQWLYEPYLDVVGSPFCPLDWAGAWHVLGETFGSGSGVRGLWVSEATDLPALLEGQVVEVVGLPLPSPDVAKGWALALRGFIQRRGAIGWGLVPQTPEGLAHARIGRLSARFGEVLQALEAGGLPVAEVVAASLIMPEDTLGDLEPAQAEEALAMTGQLAGMLRHSYGLD